MSRSFNGSSDVLRHSADIVGAFPMTAACWFNSNNITANQTIFSICDNGVDNKYIRLVARGATGGDPLTSQFAAAGSAVTDDAGGYSANVWNHGVLTLDSTTIETFLNGTGSGGTAISGRTWQGTFNVTTFGLLDKLAPVHYFDGEQAEAGMWSVVLTQSEIDSLAAGVSPSQIRPESLIEPWPLIGRNSPEIGLFGGFELTVTGAVQAAHPRIIQPSAQIIQFPPPAVGVVGNPWNYYAQQ